MALVANDAAVIRPFFDLKEVLAMIEIVGQYNRVLCFTCELESSAEAQIKAVCDQPSFADCKLRIMPDVHAGISNLSIKIS